MGEEGGGGGGGIVQFSFCVSDEKLKSTILGKTNLGRRGGGGGRGSTFYSLFFLVQFRDMSVFTAR